MGKQITASNAQTTAVYRILGRTVYLKVNSAQYANQLIEQIRQKGGSVVNNAGWLKIDMFGEHDEAKLGQTIINLKEANDASIQDILTDFFDNTLKASGMKTEIKDIS